MAKPPVSDVVVGKNVSEFSVQGTSLQRSGDPGDHVATATTRQYKVLYLYTLYSFVHIGAPTTPILFAYRYVAKAT